MSDEKIENDIERDEEEIEDGEYRLFDFPTIERVANERDTLIEVENDAGRTPRAIDLGIDLEPVERDNGEIRYELFQRILIFDRQKHVPGEKTVPRLFRNDPNFEPVVRIRPRVTILDK